MLHLQPNLVAPDFQQAPSVTGSTYAESVAAARQKDWPGYIGAPRLGNAALGRRIWTSLSAAALKTTLEILEGADAAKYPRYLPLMATNPSYQEWIASASDRDRALGKRQESWNARRQEDAKGDAAAELAALEAASSLDDCSGRATSAGAWPRRTGNSERSTGATPQDGA